MAIYIYVCIYIYVYIYVCMCIKIHMHKVMRGLSLRVGAPTAATKDRDLRVSGSPALT